MINREKIAATLGKYMAASEEYSDLLLLKKEMENLIIDNINSTYSDKEVDIARKNRESVVFQKNISLEYKLGIPWEYRHYFSKIYTLDLDSIDKPAIILSTDDITGDDPELKKDNKELYEKVNDVYKRLRKDVDSLCKKMKAIDEALSNKSMNITSIKKYYPELYNLMS